MMTALRTRLCDLLDIEYPIIAAVSILKHRLPAEVATE